MAQRIDRKELYLQVLDMFQTLEAHRAVAHDVTKKDRGSRIKRPEFPPKSITYVRSEQVTNSSLNSKPQFLASTMETLVLAGDRFQR